jgi:hypothetical protein
MLVDDWVCATTFLEQRIPRYGAHIFALRRAGFIIDRRRCESHTWHESTQWEWHIGAFPVLDEGEPCSVCNGRIGHVSTCKARGTGVEPDLFGGG